MRIGIVGCGTAGAAAAILLHDQGHEVTVFERFADPHPVGAGLLLQPTGLAVLRALSVADDVLARARRIDHFHGTTTSGRTVLDLHYADWRAGACGHGVHRHILFDALWQAVRARAVDVVTDTTVQRVPDGFDLVVGADGSRSAVRGDGARFGQRRARPYPWGALWAVVAEHQPAGSTALRQFYRSTREMVGFLPSGRPPGGTDTVSMFLSVRNDSVDDIRAAGLDALKNRVRSLAGDHAEPVLDQIHDLDQLIWAGYHDVVLRHRHANVNGTPVVLLGDAAHAMSPQLGQGANLALLDAWTLADCLTAGTPGPDVATAIATYSRRRRAQLSFYSWASRLSTVAFQSEASVLAVPRDLLMHPLARIPWVRSQLIGLMGGARTGLFGELGAGQLPT